MEGNNTLLLNKAVMIGAVDYYLNQIHFKSPVKVGDVSENKNSKYFEVKLVDNPAECPDDGKWQPMVNPA